MPASEGKAVMKMNYFRFVWWSTYLKTLCFHGFYLELAGPFSWQKSLNSKHGFDQTSFSFLHQILSMTQSQKSKKFIIAIKYNIMHSQSDSRGWLGKKRTLPKIFLNLGISTAIVPPWCWDPCCGAYDCVGTFGASKRWGTWGLRGKNHQVAEMQRNPRPIKTL